MREENGFCMSRMNKLILISILSILLISVFIPLSSVEAQEPIIGEDDVYEKDIRMGERGNFNWTVYKNSSKNYVVTVEVSGLGDWEKNVKPSYFVLDEENPYKIVSLNFKVPDYPDRDKREAEVTFTFRQLNTTNKFEITKTADINIVGITPAGEANTILGGFKNPLPEPLNKPIGAFTLNVIIWAVISFVLFSLIAPLVHQFTKKTKTKVDDIIISMIRKPLLILVFLYGLIDSFLKLNLQLGIRATTYKIYTLAVVIIGVYIVYQIFDAILGEIAERRKEATFGQVLKPVFEKIGAIVIIIGGLIIGLRAVGIEVTALLAGAGVLGLVIAFAAQDTLSNFFSGMHLLLDRPFKMGDVILLEGGEYCRVESVGMRSTKLYSIFDHELIVLPNNNIANQKVINLVEPDTKMRVKVEVGVAYGTDLDKVREILMNVAENHPDVVSKDEFAPVVIFNEFGNSSLNFILRFWVDDYMKQWRVASEIRKKIDDRFKEEGITIPFPQRTVWLNQKKEK